MSIAQRPRSSRHPKLERTESANIRINNSHQFPLGCPTSLIAPRPGVRDRIAAHVKAHALDLELAGGRAPESSAALWLRARRLTALSRRRSVAAALRRAIRGEPGGRFRVLPARDHVAAAEEALSELADALAQPGPVAARGAAGAWLMVTDGTGTLYDAGCDASLRELADAAMADLRLPAAAL